MGNLHRVSGKGKKMWSTFSQHLLTKSIPAFFLYLQNDEKTRFSVILKDAYTGILQCFTTFMRYGDCGEFINFVESDGILVNVWSTFVD